MGGVVRGTRLVMGVVAVALAVAGCTHAELSVPPPPSVGSPSPVSHSPRPHPSRSPVPPQPTGNPFSPVGGGPPGSPGVSTATVDDLKTFAFATTDEADLATQTAAMAETVGRLATDAAQRAVEAVQTDAEQLRDQAVALATDAGTATDRLQPLSPSSAAMALAHRDGVAAFGLTEIYATTATNLADAAADLDAQEFAQIAQQAASLAGTSDDLATAYADLTDELTAWAEANPTDAAKALATYGD
jgi:hypothetical protein